MSIPSLIACLLLMLLTAIYCGMTTIEFDPFTFHMERPYTAVFVVLLMLLYLFFVILALPEILKK